MPVVSKYLTLHQRPMIHPHPWIPNNVRKKIVHLFFGPRKHFFAPTPHRELLNNFRPPIDSHFKILPLMLKTSWNFFRPTFEEDSLLLGVGGYIHRIQLELSRISLLAQKYFFIVFLYCSHGFRKNEKGKLFGLPQAAFIIFGPPPLRWPLQFLGAFG